jgi:hypothetical protein
MKKFLAKLLFYGFVSVLVFNIIAVICLFSLQKSNFYKPEFLKNGVKETNFDYVVLGSSTGLTTLNTIAIDSILNKKGLNISMDDSSISSHYLMLHHFFALKKKTKILVLTVSQWDLINKKPELNNNDYRFLPFVYEKYIYDYYSEMETSFFKPLTLSRYLPIVGVSYYNTELFYPSILTAIYPTKRNRFDEKGNYFYPGEGSPTEQKYLSIKLEINNPYLSKIARLCQENQVELIVYIPPNYKTNITTNQKLNIVNHSDLIKDKKLFYDNIHVNERGRKKCSIEFAKVLITNFQH